MHLLPYASLAVGLHYVNLCILVHAGVAYNREITGQKVLDRPHLPQGLVPAKYLGIVVYDIVAVTSHVTRRFHCLQVARTRSLLMWGALPRFFMGMIEYCVIWVDSRFWGYSGLHSSEVPVRENIKSFRGSKRFRKGYNRKWNRIFSKITPNGKIK